MEKWLVLGNFLAAYGLIVVRLWCDGNTPRDVFSAMASQKNVHFALVLLKNYIPLPPQT
jgi:hypothetical protein